MRKKFIIPSTLSLGVLCLTAFGLLTPSLAAQDSAPTVSKDAITELDKALESAKEGSSEARQRLAVRRVVRDAEQQLASNANSPGRFLILEFLFRAQQQLIALDDDSKHRQALLATCRELIKAPDEFAELRLEADLLISQADLAKKGASNEERAKALKPFVERYIDTPVGSKVVRLAMVMALELGDSQLVTHLREIIEERFAGDLEMIAFQRDKLGGQVFGAPFAGVFERVDGKLIRFPMDGLGRSTMLAFWSKDNEGQKNLEALAKSYLELEETLEGRLEIISINLDGLPDAGESIVRGFGVDWQVLRFPGGRENPIYKTYVRNDPMRLTMSPTGNVAMIMSGSARQKEGSDGTPDYGRMFGSTLARQWTQPRYVQHVSSLLAGDFLVLDPAGGIDPARPPELKAVGGSEAKPLARGAGSVPEKTLDAIQEAFVVPPLRYRATPTEVRASYEKAIQLCRSAISTHPEAPDLWIVRNRLIVALLGLWKTDASFARLEEAATEAEKAIGAGYPEGCDVVARFCLARMALRPEEVKPLAMIEAFVADSGGESASGPALAAAALLSLEVADRGGFERYRETILKEHGDDPMMWTFTAFLLDRYHKYWLFQVPFTAGWSYGRREGYFLTKGDADEHRRSVHAELRTLDGETFRIPEDLDSEWTAVFFAAQGPWNSKRDDGLPPSPDRYLSSLVEAAAKRPGGDLKVYLAILGDDPEAIRKGFGEKEPLCEVLMVPGGIRNPLVHRLGILSEDNQFNSVLVGKDGRIAVAISGLASQTSRSGNTLINVIVREDEKFISSALERGEVEAAKARIFALAPPFDPEAVDEKGRKLKIPQYSLSHLRARTRVYMALEEWDKALADAEEVVQRQLGTDGGMSLRTDELDESEELRATILRKKEEAKK
jgi:tetratricopeptide (TPR) repeat protein